MRLERQGVKQRELTMTRSALIAELIHYVETTQSQLGDCPSAVVASRGDTILLERYSSGDGARLGEVDANSLWSLCSATKSYVAALLLNLCHENILNLDDPVIMHLPEFCSAGDNLFEPGLVTIRHLACHLSGVELEITRSINF